MPFLSPTGASPCRRPEIRRRNRRAIHAAPTRGRQVSVAGWEQKSVAEFGLRTAVLPPWTYHLIQS
jgi:hypothetical protein